MRVYISEELAIFLTCLVIILCLPHIAFATPFIWIDTVNGDDSSTNYMQPNNPVRTYARAIALGANGDTLGVKVKPGSALPSAQEAYIINSNKPDKVRVNKPKVEVIAGHGTLPMGHVETSAEAGLKVTTSYVWEIFTAPNGQQAERMIDRTEIVEEY